MMARGDCDAATYTLLAGSEAFCEQALADMRRATSRLFVQAMTFEGDASGLRIGDGIRQSRAADRRVLVDDFTRWVISDRMVLAPLNLLDRALQAEAKATRRMFREMARAGVGVRVTNPIGFLMLGLPFRNHKKLIVADDVAYIGGVNFSDHNFAWHDLMLRIEHAGAADRLAADFEASFAGRAQGWIESFGDLRLIGLNGRDNETGFGDLMAQIEQASSEICVVSPYLTFPFLDALKRASQRGVRVRLITPLANNKPTARDYLMWATAQAGFEVHLTADMIHLKGMLIDQHTLVLGSSNFDLVSYYAEEELLALVNDRDLIRQFEAQVIGPLLARALPVSAYRPGVLAGPRSAVLLKMAELLVRTLPFERRSARDWPD